MVNCTRGQRKANLDMKREKTIAKSSDKGKIKIEKNDVVFIEGGKHSIHLLVAHRGNELLLELIKGQKNTFHRVGENQKDLVTLCGCVLDGLAQKPTNSRFILLPFQGRDIRLMTRGESVSAIMKLFLVEGVYVERFFKMRVKQEKILPEDCVDVNEINRLSRKKQFSEENTFRSHSDTFLEDIARLSSLDSDQLVEQFFHFDPNNMDECENLVKEPIFSDDSDVE